MAVPKFEELMRPILEFLRDGAPRDNAALVERVCDHFDLSDAERNELLPSGTQKRISNRVGWAKTHLKHAGLVEAVGHGVVRATSAGASFIDSHEGPIDVKVLDQIPLHAEWSKATRSRASQEHAEDDDKATPEERLEGLVDSLNEQLSAELLAALRSGDAYRFESVVLDVLLALGYGGSRKEAATVTKKSNDEGIDGVINEDRLGLDVIYVQAKRWSEQNSVGRKDVQEFVGALAGKQAHKGVFITTSSFRDSAVEYAKAVQQRVVLIDGAKLAQLMIEHNIGVSVAKVYKVKRLDSDYFEDV